MHSLSTPKIILFLVPVMAAILNLSVAKAETVVQFVQDAAYPPYMTKQKSRAAGIYTDIVAEVDRRLSQYKISITALPWKRAKAVVKAGSAAGLMGTYFRPKTRSWIGVFSEPLYTESVAVFCRKGLGKPHWRYPEEFAHLIFGNNRGFTTPGVKLLEMAKKGLIRLQEVETTAQNITKLAAGRLDCYTQDARQTEFEIRRQNARNIEQVKFETIGVTGVSSPSLLILYLP